MKKFDFSIEHYINKAVRCRIKRWMYTWFEASTEHKVYGEEADRLVTNTRRAFKYEATHYLNLAMWNYFQSQQPQQAQEWRGRWGTSTAWMNYFRVDADGREFMREVQRRYRVVDNALGANVIRKNGIIKAVMS